MKLHDSTIAHIARALQMAILTGTDIVDNLRIASFVVEDGEIFLDPEYRESFEMNINDMLTQAAVSEDNLVSDEQFDNSSVFQK